MNFTKNDELLLLKYCLPPTFNQANRLVEFLSKNPKSPSDAVISHCSIGNLSDIARRANQYLIPEGYFVGCEKPIYPVVDEFGEPSYKGVFVWSIFCIPEQANDD